MAQKAPSPVKTWHLGFRTKIEKPTAKQREYLAKACGTARFAYNWALEQWKEQAKRHKADPEHVKAPNEGALRRQFNALKREKFPWALEVSKCAPQYAIKELGRAFANHFKNPGRFGWPKFKKKFVNDSFSISNDQFKVEGSRIRIPNLGWVRMCEPLRFKGAKVLRATISRVADEWYVSITCELSDLKHLKPAKNHGRVGVDLGIGKLATLSDGRAFEAPRPLKESLRRLKRLQRKLSRAKRDGQNRKKLKMRIARLHARIANIRRNALHHLTAFLSANYSEVVIEDLNVRGMLANHKLARAIADIGFYEFRRQLDYKMALRGGVVIVADRYFPSSKLCRFCGGKHEQLKLSDREWVCPHCGRIIRSRDLNAALNLCRCLEKKWDAGLTSVDPHASSGRTSDTALPAVASQNGEPAELIEKASRLSTLGQPACGTVELR